MAFWEDETKRRRMASYRARFMSWQLGRPVDSPNWKDAPHWWHMPMVYADTGEPVTKHGEPKEGE